jgi:hypothetical protein
LTLLTLAGYLSCILGLVLFAYDLHRQTDDLDERREQE